MFFFCSLPTFPQVLHFCADHPVDLAGSLRGQDVGLEPILVIQEPHALPPLGEDALVDYVD